MRIPHFLALSSIVVVVTLAISCQTAGAIENQKGKTYKLSEKHGPWMIMVSSFRDVREEDRKTEGMTADEAVSELIYELREKGIPAYTYSLNGPTGSRRHSNLCSSTRHDLCRCRELSFD